MLYRTNYNPEIDDGKTVIVIYNMMQKKSIPVLHEEVSQDCIITTNRKYLSVADAVVFHTPSLLDELEGDLEKPENQIWIAWSQECEENYPILKYHDFMYLFDMRMSYHQYADIVYPYYEYGYFKSIEAQVPVSEKINKCCMIISGNLNKSRRIEYLEELMKYTGIDSYGKLFNNSAIINDNGRKTKLELYSKYKFVIAFENSIADDYVTEKFFDPLLAGSVPVYLGAPNINEYSPGENCFINVRNFENPSQLADFINKCCEDDELYSKFFNWTSQPILTALDEKIENQKISPFITLCNKVKEKKQEQMQIKKDITSLGNIYFCTFADSRYRYSLERLRKQAEDMGVFKGIHICDENNLEDSFKSSFPEYLNREVRGYGYWVWKPYIIYQYLQNIDDNDVFLYLDAGCRLNYRGKKRFLNYWKTVKNNKSGFLVTRSDSGQPEKKWTKGDLLDYFNVRNDSLITETPQLQANIIFIRKSEKTMGVIKKWLSIYYSNFNLVDDSPSSSLNMEDFMEHRHDQSLFSVLLKKHGTSTFPEEEVYTSKEWAYLEKDFPILNKRDFGGNY